MKLPGIIKFVVEIAQIRFGCYGINSKNCFLYILMATKFINLGESCDHLVEADDPRGRRKLPITNLALHRQTLRSKSMEMLRFQCACSFIIFSINRFPIDLNHFLLGQRLAMGY